MTKALSAAPFALGIFVALALLSGLQAYAAALASYGGMMAVLLGWSPKPMLAKVRAKFGEIAASQSGGGSLFGSLFSVLKPPPIKSLLNPAWLAKAPFLSRFASTDAAPSAAQAAPDAPEAPAAPAIDIEAAMASMNAAREEKPAPQAIAVPDAAPVASRLPFLSQLMARVTGFVPSLLAKIRPQRDATDDRIEAAAIDSAATGEPAPAGPLARYLAIFNKLISKVVVKPDAVADAPALAIATDIAIDADADPLANPAETALAEAEPAAVSLVSRALAIVKLLLARVVARPTDAADALEPATASDGTAKVGLVSRFTAVLAKVTVKPDAVEGDIVVKEPGPGLAQRYAAARSWATDTVRTVRAMSTRDLLAIAGRVPAFALFGVIIVATMPLLLADLSITWARIRIAERRDRDDNDFDDHDLDIGGMSNGHELAQAA